MRAAHLAALLLALAGALRAGPFETTTTLIAGSDSTWRGLTLNDRDPTWSANVYTRHASGTYLGLVATGIEFLGPPGADPQVELQADLGHAFDLGRGLTLSLGVLDSHYPDASGPLDFEEPYFRLEKGRAALGLQYSPNYFGGESRSFHTWGSYALPLGRTVALDMTLADFRFSNEPNAGLVDYWYWGLGLRAELDGATAQVLYVDTEPGAVGFQRSSWTFLLSTSF